MSLPSNLVLGVLIKRRRRRTMFLKDRAFFKKSSVSHKNSRFVIFVTTAEGKRVIMFLSHLCVLVFVCLLAKYELLDRF